MDMVVPYMHSVWSFDITTVLGTPMTTDRMLRPSLAFFLATLHGPWKEWQKNGAVQWPIGQNNVAYTIWPRWFGKHQILMALPNNKKVTVQLPNSLYIRYQLLSIKLPCEKSMESIPIIATCAPNSQMDRIDHYFLDCLTAKVDIDNFFNGQHSAQALRP